MNDTILEVNNLKTYFYNDEGVLPAVDGLSFSVDKGEILAIVGESGCGKSITSLSILNLVPKPNGKIVEGEILYKGNDLVQLSHKQMQNIRGNEISMIFQEPMTALNPVFKIGHQIIESIVYHGNTNKNEAYKKSCELLKLSGIYDPKTIMNRYPHQLSGGMCQRVMIAMAIACEPEILIADEPTTALDVTIQAQILRLIQSLNREKNSAVILITHDLGVVAQLADNVLVMYAGQAVEYASTKEIFSTPMHPYTQGLIQSMPKLNTNERKLYTIEGMVPNLSEFPTGCRFAPRCPYSTKKCTKEVPALNCEDLHKVRCIRYKEIFNYG